VTPEDGLEKADQRQTLFQISVAGVRLSAPLDFGESPAAPGDSPLSSSFRQADADFDPRFPFLLAPVLQHVHHVQDEDQPKAPHLAVLGVPR